MKFRIHYVHGQNAYGEPWMVYRDGTVEFSFVNREIERVLSYYEIAYRYKITIDNNDKDWYGVTMMDGPDAAQDPWALKLLNELEATLV